MCVNTIILLSGIHPFSTLNPDCSFVWFWDSPWYLVVLVADGTILCDASSTPTMWSMLLCCALYQGQLVLPVLYQWAVKVMGCESMTLLTLARALAIIDGLTKNLCRKRCCLLCYDVYQLWQGKTLGSVAYAPMHLIMEYLYVPYAWHAWLQPPHLWVCSQTFCSQRCENSPSLRKTFITFMVCFSLLRCDLQEIFLHGYHGAS